MADMAWPAELTMITARRTRIGLPRPRRTIPVSRLTLLRGIGHHAALWSAGAVIAYDLVLYPLYSLADRTLLLGRWVRPRVRGERLRASATLAQACGAEGRRGN